MSLIKRLSETLTNLSNKKYHLNDRFIKLTKLDTFQSWFGNSVTVDRNGNPIVFFHGSEDIDNIKVFNTPSFFGSDKFEAERYVKNKSNIKPFFVRSDKLLKVDELNEKERSDILKLIKNNIEGIINYLNSELPSWVDWFEDGLNPELENMNNDERIIYLIESTTDGWFILEHRLFQNYIKSNGYDGFTTQENHVNIATFNPNYIKIADCSNTTFDINSKNIYK